MEDDHSRKDSPGGNAIDLGFSLMGPFNLASRTGDVEVTIKTVPEGHQAIADVVVEKRPKAMGPGCPCRMTR